MGSLGNTTLWGQLLPGGGSSGTTAVTKVSDILYRAARLGHLLGAAQRGLASGEQADLFNWLNMLVDSWNTQRLIAGYAIPRVEWPLNVGQQDYLIGPAADDPIPGNFSWLGPRPERIEAASMITLANPQQPMELPVPILTYDEWQMLPVKRLTSSLIQAIYYEPQVPNGIVHVWPIPTVFNPIALYTWQSLVQFVSVDDQVIVPPGYLQAMVYNLAINVPGLFPERHLTLDQIVVDKAKELRAEIKRVNFPKLTMRCDPSLNATGGYYNIYTDGYPNR